MALPDIVLNSNELVVTQATGSEIVFDTNASLFGQVKISNDLDDRYSASDYVWFDPEGSVAFTFDSVKYLVINTNKVIFKENYSAP